MKFLFSLLFVGLGFCSLSAQLDSTKLATLQSGEAQLKQLGDTLIQHPVFEKRQAANYEFIRTLTKTLKTENSYEYDFPDLQMVSIVRAPDNAFRLFTWQIETEASLIRHFGAIQINNPELKLMPLIDRSDDIQVPNRYVGDNKNWYGSLVYEIQEQKQGKAKMYFLFGIDMNNEVSTKKVIDVLQFNEDGTIVMGAPIFPSPTDPIGTDSRFILEYRGDASTSVRYNKDLKRVVFDHLAPIDKQYEGMYAYYVPDGTYDALKWGKGQWILERNVIETNFDNLEDIDNQDPNRERKSDSLYKPNR